LIEQILFVGFQIIADRVGFANNAAFFDLGFEGAFRQTKTFRFVDILFDFR
jgi:hypothetical protein